MPTIKQKTKRDNNTWNNRNFEDVDGYVRSS